MKFKHHLNERNMAHFSFLWLVSETPGYFSLLRVVLPIYTVHRLSYNKSAE